EWFRIRVEHFEFMTSFSSLSWDKASLTFSSEAFSMSSKAASCLYVESSVNKRDYVGNRQYPFDPSISLPLWRFRSGKWVSEPQRYLRSSLYLVNLRFGPIRASNFP